MANPNRNLFRLTRFILLKFPLLFGFFGEFRKPQKCLLIIKTDAIGDYVLFRNFIEVVSRSDKYKDYQLDILGNALWADIALNYDSAFVKNFFFINAEALYHSPLKVLRQGWRLFKNNYEVVLQPSYSRTFMTDGLAALASAKQLIGFEGDTERIIPKYKLKTDRFYTQRLLLPVTTRFEFDRSKFFFETVLSQPVTLNGPYINFNRTGKKGIVIFPGAGIFKRGWEAGKFLELIKRILQQSPRIIYLAGGPAEVLTGAYLVENLPPDSVVNLIDKTSLPQLINLIGNAELIISNETSAIHMAVAAQTKAICILGGGHFERFAPYPDHFPDRPICVYEKMECYYCNWECIYKTREDEAFPCIDNVSLENVWSAVSNVIDVS